LNQTHTNLLDDFNTSIDNGPAQYDNEEESLDSEFSSLDSLQSSTSSIQTWEEDLLDDNISIISDTIISDNNINPNEVDSQKKSISANEVNNAFETSSNCSNSLGNTSYIRNKFEVFNINKQYNHECCAKLMLKGDFSYLSIQKTFTTNTKENRSWVSYRVANLAFKAKHQV